MICDEAKELVPSYSIGALDREEAEDLQEHLNRCSDCGALYLEFAEVAGHIPFAIESITPAPELKERLFTKIDLLEEVPSHPSAIPTAGSIFLPSDSDHRVDSLSAGPTVSDTRAKGSKAPWIMAAGLAATVILAVWLGTLQARLGQLEQRYNAVSSSLELQSEMLEGMSGTATLVKGLEGTIAAPEAKGMMFLSPTNTDALLVTFGLPPLSPDTIYQLWLIADGARVSGGTFSVNDRGYGMAAVAAPMPLQNYQAVGVTTEPRGGSPSPSGERMMAANLR